MSEQADDLPEVPEFMRRVIEAQGKTSLEKVRYRMKILEACDCSLDEIHAFKRDLHHPTCPAVELLAVTHPEQAELLSDATPQPHWSDRG